MRRFTLVWLGQVLSTLGSGLTRFVLGVWIYRQTGSATSFALYLSAGAIPHLLLLPVAGALVDRWDRRAVLLASDAASAAVTLAVATLLHSDALQVWHMYVAMAVWAALGAFQGPALVAATGQLVPPAQRARASGMSQSGTAAALALAPPLSALLLPFIGIAGVVMVDFASFFFALFALAVVRIPRLPVDAEAARVPLRRAAQEGWRYLAARPAYRWMMGYLVVVLLVSSGARMLVTPLVLATGSAQSLGWVLSVGMGGMVAGGALVAVRRGPWRLRGSLAGGGMMAASLVATGLAPTLAVVAAGVFGIYFSLPVIDACMTVAWQTRAPHHLHGRIAAVFRTISGVAMPVAYGAAGVLADRVFEPLLAPRGALAAVLGPVFGTGQGRGTALLYVLLGLVMLLATAAAYASPAPRRLEEDAEPASGSPPERVPAPAEAT